MIKKALLVFIVGLIIGGIAFFTTGYSQTAPNVTFTKLDSTQFKTSDLKGKVVLVKFWATDCTTCIAQMPETVALYNKYKDQGYDTVAVSMQYDALEYVKNYTTNHNLPFIVTHDQDGSNAKAFDNVKYTPVAFLLNRNGDIVKRYVGNYKPADFEQTLQKTLANR